VRRVLVTGANKGIGLAIVNAILSERDDTFVFLGSRDPARGEMARRALLTEHPTWDDRLAVVQLDVTSDASVGAMVEEIRRRCGEQFPALFGVVNNAGVGGGADLRTTFSTNTLGMRRVCEACVSLLDPSAGRIVNVTSASGPIFVGGCSPDRRRLLTNSQIEWSELEGFIHECLSIENGKEGFARRGLGDGSPYGLSKACANSYTLLLARRFPSLKINACTPGYIETDLTRPYAASQGKTPAEMGMRPPHEGTRSVIHLLFAELEGNGHYYGSDAQRSPLDRYRAPGSEPYRD